MRSRSPAARAVISTRYGILLAHFVEDFVDRSSSTGMHVRESFANRFVLFGLSGQVEKAFVGSGLLNDDFRLTVYREGDGAVGGLELLNKLRGILAEGSQGLDVRGGVDHGCLRCQDSIVALRDIADSGRRKCRRPLGDVHISKARYGAPGREGPGLRLHRIRDEVSGEDRLELAPAWVYPPEYRFVHNLPNKPLTDY